MKFINFVTLTITLCFSFLSIASGHMMSVNSDDLRKLSRNTFKLKIDRNRNVRVSGVWPDVCAKSVVVDSVHHNSNLVLTIKVDLNCYDLIQTSSTEVPASPSVSMKEIVIKGVVRPNEKVVLSSVHPSLDLTLSPSLIDSIMREQQYSSGEPPTSTSILTNKYGAASRKSTLDGGLSYRKCDPNNYGTNNPGVCNGQYGLDLNADLKLNDSTSLRGTTQLDIQNQPGDSITGKAGIRLDILIQIDDTPK